MLPEFGNRVGTTVCPPIVLQKAVVRRLNKEFPALRIHLLGDPAITDNGMKICVNLRNLRIELPFLVSYQPNDLIK